MFVNKYNGYIKIRKRLLLNISCLLLIVGCRGTVSADMREDFLIAKTYANQIFPDSLLRVFPTGLKDSTLISYVVSFKYPSVLNDKANMVHAFPWIFVESHIFNQAAEYHSIKNTISRTSLRLIDTTQCFDIYQASRYEPSVDFPEKPVFVPVYSDSVFPADSTTISHLPKSAELFIDKIGYHQLIYDKDAEKWQDLVPEIGHGYESGAAFLDDYLWASFWVIVW